MAQSKASLENSIGGEICSVASLNQAGYFNEQDDTKRCSCE